ncbi:MAG: hypothetical protein J6B50_09315 [Lachnospiraceae bacterium]|nr:hypothetical protein [Lachnospiraceae bacterium]
MKQIISSQLVAKCRPPRQSFIVSTVVSSDWLSAFAGYSRMSSRWAIRMGAGYSGSTQRTARGHTYTDVPPSNMQRRLYLCYYHIL